MSMSRKTSVQRILSRFDQLIEAGQGVLASEVENPGTYYAAPNVKKAYPNVDTHLFSGWRVGCLSLLSSLFGEDHVRYRTFDIECGEPYAGQTKRGLALLESARDEVEFGGLRRLEEMVFVDVSTSFLDMARHLHDEGHKDPAALLAGAVLEDGLRRIASAQELSGDNIKALNDRLVQARVYNRLTYKSVAVWNDLRNRAAHGKFEEYDAALVGQMIDGVETLLERYL